MFQIRMKLTGDSDDKASACDARDPFSIPWGQGDSLEKGMTTRFGILAWRIPWTEEPGGPRSIRSQMVRRD